MELHMPTTAKSTTFPLSSPSFSLPATLLLTSFIFLFPLRNVRFAKPNTTKNSLPPGPAPWPLIGSLPAISRNKPAFRWILKMMEEMDTNIACIRLGNTHVIPVTCPKIAREFLKKQDAIFATRPVAMAPEYASGGYLTAATTPWGDQWKKMRRLVACELLNPSKLRWFLHKRTGEADNLVRYIHTQCKNRSRDEQGAVVNVREAAQHYCGNVIRKLIFNVRYFGAGREDGGPGVEEEEHVEAIFTVLSLLYVFDVADYLPMFRCLDLEGHEKVMKRAVEIVNKYHDPIIESRIMRWRSGSLRDPEDMLDLMILAKDGDGNPLLSAEEIKAQITELMIATVDNPSNNAEWAIAEMINQPSILKKAVEELDRVVGKERLVQETDIPHLNYVKACAREAFRLHPLAPFNVPHVSTADTNVAGYFIPKGSAVLLSRYGLGRNPKVWDEPLQYKPERHLMGPSGGEVELTEPDLRFISFSTGRRGCVGVSLGSEMTIMLLARLLQGFHWSAPAGQQCIPLSESADDLFLAKPLHAHAQPRLPPHLYDF